MAGQEEEQAHFQGGSPPFEPSPDQSSPVIVPKPSSSFRSKAPAPPLLPGARKTCGLSSSFCATCLLQLIRRLHATSYLLQIPCRPTHASWSHPQQYKEPST